MTGWTLAGLSYARIMKTFRVICLVLSVIALVLFCLITIMATSGESVFSAFADPVISFITRDDPVFVALLFFGSLAGFILGLVVWFLTGTGGVLAKRIQTSRGRGKSA